MVGLGEMAREGAEMSDCRHGGRDAYERPSRWDGVEWREPMHPIEIAVVFEDGSRVERTICREVNGVERKVARVMVDGEAYTSDGVNLVEHLHDGYCYAVELDGTRYIHVAERDWDSGEVDE